MALKAIIVDDEPPARRELQRMLAVRDDIRIVGEAGDLRNARGLLLRTRPDVVFLDIALGGESGFDLLNDVDPDTAVVFVTAFDQYAVRAFEANALDYLLKPVEAARLEACLTRLRLPDHAAPLPSSYSSQKWLFLDSGEQLEFIEIANIACIQADQGTTLLTTRDGVARRTSKKLTEWEQRLPAGDFIRAHRSAIVNLQHVQSVQPWSNYSYRIFVQGCAEPIIMSRRFAVRLRDLRA